MQLEVLLKLIIWRPRLYWKESGFNRLDLLLVTAAILGNVFDLLHVASSQVCYGYFIALLSSID
jgi:hypothetical protein